ncbi:hypothetical protein BGX24_004907 [Mortierella sp. AD032]|nr:hypothetical protein BGX24_004907 [Mortierella sp. AD032]
MAVSPITGMRIWVAFLTFINFSVTISFFTYYAALTDLTRQVDPLDESNSTGLEWGDICSIIIAVMLFGIYAYSAYTRDKVNSLIQNKFLRAILILIPTGLFLYINCEYINRFRIVQISMDEFTRNLLAEHPNMAMKPANVLVCDKDDPYCFLMLTQIFLAVITGLFVVVEVAMSFFMSPPRPSPKSVDF